MGLPCGPLRDQHALVGVDQGAGGDEEERRHGARRSAPVVGVDGDVFGGEVAGPDRRAARRRARGRRGCASSAVLHVGGDRLLRIGGVALALEGDAVVAEPDRRAGRGRPARRPCRPPSPRGPNWRPRRRAPSSPAANCAIESAMRFGGGVRLGAGDRRSRRTSSAPRRRARPAARDRGRGRKAPPGMLPALAAVESSGTPRARRVAGGEGEQRVGGRGVAVDGDGVEAACDRARRGTPAAPPARSARR